MTKYKCLNKKYDSGKMLNKIFDGNYTWGQKLHTVRELALSNIDGFNWELVKEETTYEKTIIAYRLINLKYEKIVSRALGMSSIHTPNMIITGMIGYYLPRIKELGIIDWFEPVYKEDIKEEPILIELPRDWYIKVTPESFDKISKWRTYGEFSMTTKDTARGICLSPTGYFDGNSENKSRYTEISFDDFKRLVLKEDIMSTEKTIKLSLDQAKKMYGKNTEMDELLLANFSKEELTKKELPKSWEDISNVYGYFIDPLPLSEIKKCTFPMAVTKFKNYKHRFATEKQAKSALAMAQLSQLMALYNDGWEADWKSSNNYKYIIYRQNNKISIDSFSSHYYFLAFKSAELRDEFLKNFESLIREYFMID